MPRGVRHSTAVKCECDGYKFDSKFEMGRYLELKLLEMAGEIQHLEVHPRFALVNYEKFVMITELRGKNIRYYTADFAYFEKDKPRVQVVEECKGRMLKYDSFRCSTFIALYPDIDFRIIKQQTRRKRNVRGRKVSKSKRSNKSNKKKRSK